MRLFIFNSENDDVFWKRTVVAVAVFMAVILVIWEIFWRSMGFVVSHHDSNAFWSTKRDLASEVGSKGIIITGSSRVFYGLDANLIEKRTGRPVVQLAVNGGATLPLLEDLAQDESITGTIICGIVPLYFFDLRKHYKEAQARIRYYRQRSPSEKAGQWIAFQLEKLFVYPEKDELFYQIFINSAALIKGIRFDPGISKQLVFIDGERRTFMPPLILSSSEVREALARKLRTGLNSPELPDEKDLEDIIGRTAKAVSKLKSRNASIVFVRMPSSGKYLEAEKKFWPREKFWDRLVQRSGAPAVYYEDHSGLDRFMCPDDSHLSKEDASLFTERFLEILAKDGFLKVND